MGVRRFGGGGKGFIDRVWLVANLPLQSRIKNEGVVGQGWGVYIDDSKVVVGHGWWALIFNFNIFIFKVWISNPLLI